MDNGALTLTGGINDDEIITIGDSKIRLVDAINYITKRTDELVFVKEGTEKKEGMRIPYIPLIIFGELSTRFGVGGLKQTSVLMGEAYQTQQLKENDPCVGFPGAIGIRGSRYNNGTTFALWGLVPRGEPDNVFEPLPLLELRGGEEEAGVWAYGQGNLMTENIRANFPSRGVSIRGVNIAATRLLAMILFRAHQLVLDPTLKADRFWEAERQPGDYTHSD